MKEVRLTIVITIAALTSFSCVSPFYGTARIEKGFHADAGLAGMRYLVPNPYSWGFWNVPGGQIASELRYGINEYIGFHTRASVGAGLGFPIFFSDVALGAQASLPTNLITPAFRAEMSLYGGGVTFSPAILLGIGKKEFLTFGARVYIFGNAADEPHPEYGAFLEDTPVDSFIVGHVWRFNIFVGSQAIFPSLLEHYWPPISTLGVGFKLK